MTDVERRSSRLSVLFGRAPWRAACQDRHIILAIEEALLGRQALVRDPPTDAFARGFRFFSDHEIDRQARVAQLWWRW